MKSVHWLTVIYVISFLLFPLIRSSEKIEAYRPKELKAGEESKGILAIFKSLIALTLALIVLKLIGFKLRWIIDLAVFTTGYIFGSLFDLALPTGLVLVSLRNSGSKNLYNISSALTIVFFSLILSKFITPKASMLLMALLSLYDVIGVLYLPYIKFLWLEFTKKSFEGIAIISDDGFVGAGDFAIPLIFSLSFGFLGFLSLPLFLLAFFLTSSLSKRFGAFPGLPLQAFLAFPFYLAFS